MKRLIIVGFALALVLTPVAARAQAGGGGAAPAASGPGAGQSFKLMSTHRANGLMFNFGFGASGCTDDLCDTLDPLVYMRLQAFYRTLNFLAVGLHLGFPFFDADSRGVDAVYNVFLGPEIRGILPIGPLDVWMGLAFGWFRHQGDGEVCLGMFCAEGSAWSDGFGIAWGLGAMYFVTKAIGVGLDFYLYKGILAEFCIEQGGDTECDDVDDQDGVGITWMVGLSATFFLGM